MAFAQVALCCSKSYWPLSLWASFLESNDNENVSWPVVGSPRKRKADEVDGVSKKQKKEEEEERKKLEEQLKVTFLTFYFNYFFGGQHEK